MRIAVVGSGIAGNTAAWALTQPMGADDATTRNTEVVMYERRTRTGGHSCTVTVDYEGEAIPVDIGFIVYNTLNYPNLVALFDHLDVETIKSDMSFGVSMAEGGLEWSGKTLDTVFAQKRNIASPRFLMMLRDIFRFNKQAPEDLASGSLFGKSLGAYLSELRVSRAFVDFYLAPMGAAIWSTPHADVLDFPAESFVRFFNNHRLLHRERPKWRTVKSGSRSYVDKITAPFRENIRLGCAVKAVERRGPKVCVTDETGHEDLFDHVIFASHTDQTLAAIKDPSEQERSVLGAIRYRPNTVYLHRDDQLMPRRRKVWSAWNYIETPHATQKETGVCVSYWMNALQKIRHDKPVFVSLNPATPPRDDLIFHEATFDHPQFDAGALHAQRALETIQGQNRLWFCGAWCGYGFHEDGLSAGLDVAERLGGRVPWREPHTNSVPQLEAAE
ncbi:MAG: FAD-dependent oxidoreductase [Pseudomonadota bacterium]